MKTALTVITILVFLHVLALIGVVGWLGASDRLSEQRAMAVVELFKPTVEEEQAQNTLAADLAAQAQAQADRQARIDRSVGMGSAADQIDAEQKRNELMLRKIERSRRELEDLQRNLELARQAMDHKREEMIATKQDLDARLAQIERQLNDEGFKKAIEMYEQLPAKQVKAMFEELIGRGQMDQVVAYMEAMDPRKAGKVLAEFKNDVEISAAVELTERLRARGTAVVGEQERAG